MKPNRKSNLFLPAISLASKVAVVMAFSLQPSIAATLTWDNDTDVLDGDNTDFSNAFNWGAGPTGAVPGTGDLATFTGAAVTSPVVTAPVTVQGISFSDAGSSGYTLSGSAVTLTNTGTGATTSALHAANNVVGSANSILAPIILGGAAGTTARFNQGSNGNLVLAGNISSTNLIAGVNFQPISNTVSSTFTLSGTNSYNGSSTLGFATFNVNSATAFSSGTVVYGNNPRFNNTSGAPVTIANAQTVGTNFTFAGTSSESELTFSGALDLSGGSRTIDTLNPGGRLVFSGTVNVGSGTRQHIKNGSGTLALTNAISGTGLNATIASVVYNNSPWRASAGILEVANAAVLGSSLDFRAGLAASTALTLPTTIVHATNNTTIGGSNNIELGGAYILSNGANSRTLNIANTGTTTISAPVSLTDLATDAAQTLTVSVDGSAGTSEISGVIQNLVGGGVSTNGMGFAKSGPGALTLSGANTFSGGLNVTGGTLLPSNPGALGASTNAIAVSGSGVLQLAGNTTYTIGGSLTVASGGTLGFGITATSGVSSKITGAGTALYNGAFLIDLPLTNPPDGATWTIADPSLNETYGTTFVVSGWTGSVESGGWAYGTGTGVYTFKQATGVITFAADNDGDSLPDAWEIANSLNPNDGTGANGADGDPDGDGFINLEEFSAGSNPKAFLSVPGDTDGDTLNDNWELRNFGNLATGNVDSDGDGFLNKAEQDAGSAPNDIAWTPVKAKLAHRWSFNGNLNDSVGSSNATIVEAGTNNATLNADSITLAGGTQATSDYVNLGPNLIGSKTTPVTVELWATQDSAKDNARIFTFGSTAADAIYMSWTRGTNLNQDRVEWADNGVTSATEDTNARYTLGTKYHIVLTLTPSLHSGGTISTGTRVTWYRAAVGTNSPLWNQRGSFDTTNTLVTLADLNNYLGRSLGGENSASATYDEVRIWDGALTQTERTVSHSAGPNVIDLTTDSDSDGLPDSWETADFGNLGQGNVDSDGDGIVNSVELLDQSNPNNIASLASDVDADGLADYDFEVAYFGDLDENGTGDFDGDLATNELEETSGTNPATAGNYPDTEDSGAGDGLNDGWELFYFGNLAQNGAGDPDADGEDNSTEFLAGTNPTDRLSRSIVPPLFTFISPLARNGGFELLGPPPGTSGSTAQQIWDAAGANDVTYWTEWVTQQTAQGNSGTLSSAAATEGTRRAFMQTGNAVYNLTDYISAAGNIYWLAVDKVADNGPINFYLVYQDSGGVIQQVPGALLTTSTTGSDRLLGFQIPAGSPAIGRRIGVGAHCVGGNFPGMDNVRFGVVAADSDGDTYDDAFEDNAWGDNDGLVEASDLTSGPAGDADGDGISSLNEVNGTLNTVYGNAPTRANDADSDDDGLSDGMEIITAGTNPNLADTDRDGLDDGVEINTFKTNPLVTDSDGDGYKDGVEVSYGSDPAIFDSVPDLHQLIGLTKRNGSFELLNGVVTGAKANRWDVDPDGDVDNWTVWTEQSTADDDSGTEGTGSAFRNGNKHAYLQANNAVRNVTPYTIKEGDVIRLSYSRTTAGNINAYLVAGSTVAPGPGTVQISGTSIQTTNIAGDGYELVFQVPAGHPTIGQLLGVAFKSTGGFNGLDKVILEVKDRDADGDGLSDFWEDRYFGNGDDDVTTGELALQTGAGDADGDGASNAAEQAGGSSPTNGLSTPTDVDGDQLADLWETANFGSIAAQGGAGDPDGDGSSNLTEFRLSLNPNDGGSRFAATTPARGIICWPSASGVTFTIQRSTDLATWTILQATFAGTAGTATYTDGSAPDGNVFYRIGLNP